MSSKSPPWFFPTMVLMITAFFVMMVWLVATLHHRDVVRNQWCVAHGLVTDVGRETFCLNPKTRAVFIPPD